jgi:hypothetical protein
MRSRVAYLVAIALAGGVVAGVIAFTGSFVAAAVVGVLVLATSISVIRVLTEREPDPERRRFLRWSLSGLGVAFFAGGAVAGRAAKRLSQPDPRPTLEAAAHDIGSEYLDLVTRMYHPTRSGDLQMLVTPYSTANYPQESRDLEPNDPRSSHAVVWFYGQRVPIVVWAPGIVPPFDSTERVTLADLAPTTAALMKFEDFQAADGRVLPGLEVAQEAVLVPRPKVIVTLVIDGGGWNVLHRWPDAWPNLKRLMREGGVYRNAITGSFPAVTAAAHATIGTGAYPRTHGITGHNVRYQGDPVKAWGTPGRANPDFLLEPTLADRWTAQTQNQAWVGEIGYQIWHLGMLGHGGRPNGQPPVAMLWDEAGEGGWIPQHPERYRLPNAMPDPTRLDALVSEYQGLGPSAYDRWIQKPSKQQCCFPPIVRYQGEVIQATLDSEPIGQDDVTDLLYINFKAPDYTGHVYNMDDEREAEVLEAVDAEVGALADNLRERYGDGGFVLIVTADHGQCPLIDPSGGVRIDPIQLEQDLRDEFGDTVFKLVLSVAPSEVYFDPKALADAGYSLEDVAAFLTDYRYGDNIGPYVHDDAIVEERFHERAFAAVFPKTYLADLVDRDLSGYGETQYPNADPDGIAPITW